jgi:DegV family protein with EDD domain
MLSLFADTDMDMTPDVAEKYHYHLISMPYSIGEKEYFPYVGDYKFNAHEFYESLRHGTIPKTCGLSPEQYLLYFEPEFAKGNDILYVHFSSAMSGTFNAMRLAVEELQKKYPERHFYEIDTKGITILSYNIALEVGDLTLEGKNIDEILAWAKEEVDHFATYFYADDLRFFHASGRVSGLTATMGSLFAIKPIIYMDEHGKMVVKGKEAGHLNAIKRILRYMEELGDEVEKHRVVIADTDYNFGVKKLVEMIKAHYGDKLNIIVVQVNPTSGAHCGPNCIGVCFHSKHR